MKLSVGIWYYNKTSDTFLYCAEMLGRVTVQTYSRVPDTDLVQYSPNNDEMEVSDLPEMMLKGYRPFGKIKGRGYLQKIDGKPILTIPRKKMFEERVKEELPSGYDEEVFRKIAYDFPDIMIDMLVDTDDKL